MKHFNDYAAAAEAIKSSDNDFAEVIIDGIYYFFRYRREDEYEEEKLTEFMGAWEKMLHHFVTVSNLTLEDSFDEETGDLVTTDLDIDRLNSMLGTFERHY